MGIIFKTFLIKFVTSIVAMTNTTEMSQVTKDFDNKTLFEVLSTAIAEDKRYWIQNDAKIRASYTAKNYDEFRETVAAAHLSPLDKRDKDKKIKNWNSVAKTQENQE